MPPARMTALASDTISWKEAEGSRRRNLRVMLEFSVDKLDWEEVGGGEAESLE